MLFKLKQQPTQTVEQYATMLKEEKGEKAQKTDREILSFFINGLRPPIQAFVAGKAPADFASAYLQAKTAEVVTALPQEPSRDDDELQQIIGKLGGLQQEVKDIKTKIDDRRPLREPQRPKQVYGGRTLQHAQGSLCMLWLVMLAVLLLSTRYKYQTLLRNARMRPFYQQGTPKLQNYHPISGRLLIVQLILS
ncbi:uncharacterized protein [Ptychodera flava]|uniref:uncharacterized protein n=1 Tax=Ptychodera flava TaxID=63121 RepID=UPI00396A6386